MMFSCLSTEISAATHCTQTFSNRNGQERGLSGFTTCCWSTAISTTSQPSPGSTENWPRERKYYSMSGSNEEENVLLTPWARGQSWQTGWRPWKDNREWNKHCLQPGSAECRLWKLIISNLDPSCIQSRIISETACRLFHWEVILIRKKSWWSNFANVAVVVLRWLFCRTLVRLG